MPTPTGASLLGFLHEGPLSGWDLLAKAEGTIGDFWNVTKSQVYRELESLTAAGYVTQGKEEARARRPYSLTARGRTIFATWLAETPGPLLMRWPLALTAFFGEHVEPANWGPVLAKQRAHHEQMLRTLEAFVPMVGASEKNAHVAAVLSLGIRFHRMVVEWIDEIGQTTAFGGRPGASRGQRKERK